MDQNGAQHVISETYHDASGKLLSTKNVGGITGSIWTKFNYNAIGELLTYTDAQNLTTEYTYDMLGRKVEVKHPDKGTTRYKYDNINLIAVQTQNLINEDKFINYEYNFNRLMNVVFPEMPSGENISNVHYKYGNTGNETGRVIAINDATGVQIFKYGVMGETIEIDRTIVAPNLPTRNFKTTFDYDSFNRIQKLIYPDGESLSYLYNRGGNVNQMITQLNGQEYEYVKQIDYDYFEQKTYMKYGNNTETVYKYSPELRRLQNLNVKASDGQNMFNNAYSYDKVGNITKIENNADFNTTNYMGGVYENIYDYDNLNRLIRAKGGFTGFISRGTGHNLQAYNLKMDYNDTHGIIQKNQSHTTHGYLPVYENTYSNKYEYMENTHKTIAITNEENGTVDEFKYDNNGNMKVNSNSNNFREMFWDESNRLRVVYDQNSYQMQHYIYDAAGERTLKASSKIENVYENGQVESNNTTMGLYTTYVSPYMVVDANQKYSKHYFNGTQRVASKIGEQDIAIFENGNQYLKQESSKTTDTPSIDFDALKTKQITDFSYYVSKSTNNATAKNVKVNYTEYKKADTNTETTSAKAADNNSAFAAPQYAEIYYYHSDHLGTGTFLSDFEGNPYQFFLNLPFGETMAEQHSYSGDYTNRYKFNGKELDEETGFYYYGARYYNPKFSIWLSVDPLAEKYPNESPYVYCANNPIIYIDPDGREKIVVVGDQEGSPNSDRKNRDNNTGYKYGENTRHFLQAGLDSARAYKKNAGDEMVTMIIYKGQYTDAELKLYQDAGTKSGINVKVISDDADIIDYINKKQEFAFSTTDRDNDLITDFTYVGHGWTKSMLVGGGSVITSDAITPSDLNTKAFDVNANIFLNSCGSAYGSLFSGMKEKTKGTVTGFNSTVIWGEKGIGSYRGNTQEYYYPWQNRESKNRKELPPSEVMKSETGTRQ